MGQRGFLQKLNITDFGKLNIKFIQAVNVVWSLTPDSNYPSKATVNSTQILTVKYIVKSQSNRSHTLRMKPISGGYIFFS